MPVRSRTVRRVLTVAAALVVALTASVPAGAASPTRSSALTATTLTPSDRISGAKSPTSRLAQSDPALLARRDSKMVNVMVKLDYDSLATYAGTVRGLSATNPSITGHKLSATSTSVKAYRSFVTGKENAFIRSLQALVPTARIGTRLSTVYGGIAIRVPASAVAKIARIKGVVAVQYDRLEHKLTDSSPGFIGADTVYDQLGTTANAGQGVIFGDIDTGVWPEHPSFADQGNLPPPPGGLRTCDFGDNPLTPADDPFQCNNKLIGGQAFLATYLSDPTRASAETYTTARDSDGHGTHTTSTAAGDIVDSAPVLGIDRGPIHGIAPGAYVIEYKALGVQGGFSSDLSAAVGQAIFDGVDVINYSISGGSDPFTDPTELAFLDAYAAGVTVAAAAGNSGPGAGTADHLSPWTITVGASTQTREFTSHLTVTDGTDTFETDGSSLTAGVGPLPVVLSSAAPYSNDLCDAPAAPGTFTGMIVACKRGVVARVAKGYNVAQGGAAGMILYNPTLADTETDNHWLPAVHLADGTAFVAFLNAHPGSTAQFTAGAKTDGQGDVMAAFSSRGPGGNFIKPDVSAPGVQILAGNTPTPDATDLGPSGQYFQAIAGTSMAAPHVAGAAILVRAVHPYWTPGQIKSALMTTAKTGVVKEDLTTPADPFDDGGGRIDVAAAVKAPLTFDETANDFFDLAADPLHAIDLNLPSINAPLMPGTISTSRVAVNSSGKTQSYSVATTAPAKSSITVSPASFTLLPGAAVTLRVTITSTATLGAQQFGQIRITSSTGVGTNRVVRTVHLPVAFIHTQGDVTLTQSCSPLSIRRLATSLCTIKATNHSFVDQAVTATTVRSGHLTITSVSGASRLSTRTARASNVLLTGGKPGVPSLGSLGFDGYLPLDLLGVAPEPIGDEDMVNFDTPGFLVGGVTYTRVGVDSNGYLVLGGGSSQDNECCNLPSGPSPARPNDILAPFWTDLNGEGADGLLAAQVSDDSGNSWIVFEWRVNVFGTSDLRTFQVWLGLNGVQDVEYAYPADSLPYADPGQPFLVGAENALGQGDMSATLPADDYMVVSTAPTPGGSLTYKVRVQGTAVGSGTVSTSMTATYVPGITQVSSAITIRR